MDITTDTLTNLLAEYEPATAEQLTEQSIEQHSELFPEDLLLGASPFEQYKQWYNEVFLPKVKAMGDKGKQVMATLKQKDWKANAEDIAQAVVLLGVWFFPASQKDLATLVALWIIIKKIKNDDDKTK